LAFEGFKILECSVTSVGLAANKVARQSHKLCQRHTAHP